jgi:prepilin-type N-terminal cleavage/methylation domain-containing protein
MWRGHDFFLYIHNYLTDHPWLVFGSLGRSFSSMQRLKFKAFTLIELLIVVAIIAILAAIAVPNFLEAQTRAKVSRARADMRSIAVAIEAYAVDNNKYAPNRHPLGDVNLPAATYPDNTNIGTVGIAREFNHMTVPLRFTTPIAYITTTINDPFKTGAAVRKSAASGAVTMGPNTNPQLVYDEDQTTKDFHYSNIDQLATDPAFNGFGFDDRDLASYGGWRLTSIGPDQEFFGSIGRRIYDPTNGTTSLGDIVRTALSSAGRTDESTLGSN